MIGRNSKTGKLNPKGGKIEHLFALGVRLASHTLNQKDEMGVPGVAQEGSRAVSQGALAAFSGPRVTTMVSLGSKIEATVARNAAKRNEFERISFSRGRHIVLSNKKESLSPGRRGQNENETKQEQPTQPPHEAMGEGGWAMGVAPVWKLCLPQGQQTHRQPDF